MSTVGRFFLWFWLVPYFWVKSWNTRPLFGEDRVFANRLNGLVVLGVIFAVVGLGVLTVDSSLPSGSIPAVCLYLLGTSLAAVLLNKDRERRLFHLYQEMPIRNRRAFGLITLAASLF